MIESTMIIPRIKVAPIMHDARTKRIRRHALFDTMIPLLWCIAITSGASFAKNSPDHAKDTEDIQFPIRDVRVLLVNNTKRLHIRSDHSIDIIDDRDITINTFPPDDWIEFTQYQNERIHVNDEPISSTSIVIKPTPGNTISLSRFRGGKWSDPRTYHGTIQIRPDKKVGLDVINFVPVEQYVSCVVAYEVWPTFEIEAFRVQAIVSRTYVLYQMMNREKSTFDVSATQGSQVYRGIRKDSVGQKAALVTKQTRGVALTWLHNGEDQLFCAYYSAACGGLSQSAAIFGIKSDIEPLHGKITCEYCKTSPKGYYRWGPVKISKQKIYAKLAARYKDFSTLSYIESIMVTDRTPAGRPINLRITGANEESIDILAERFRLTVNGSAIRSTNFSIKNLDNYMVFDDGKGFGHGLGLCQWGAQGLAQEGKLTADILRFYYPGCRIMRVY